MGKKLLATNISRYQHDGKAVHNSDGISKMLDSIASVNNLPAICETSSKRRLLRYPILVNAGSRDAIYQKLKQAGLGVSTMYPASLPEIEGLESCFSGQYFPQAQAFASQLITLPVHAKVSARDIEKMAVLLKSV